MFCFKGGSVMVTSGPCSALSRTICVETAATTNADAATSPVSTDSIPLDKTTAFEFWTTPSLDSIFADLNIAVSFFS